MMHCVDVRRRAYASQKRANHPTELCRAKTLLEAALTTRAPYNLGLLVSLPATSNLH